MEPGPLGQSKAANFCEAAISPLAGITEELHTGSCVLKVLLCRHLELQCCEAMISKSEMAGSSCRRATSQVLGCEAEGFLEPPGCFDVECSISKGDCTCRANQDVLYKLKILCSTVAIIFCYQQRSSKSCMLARQRGSDSLRYSDFRKSLHLMVDLSDRS